MSRPSRLDHLEPAPSDEALANDARRRLRSQGIIAVEPDERIGVMLAAGERVVSVRRGICIERRKDAQLPGHALVGDLYVTTRRVVCLGPVAVEVPLAAISEAVVASGALRLFLDGGRGLEIRIADPKLLRVEIAAVRAGLRVDGGQ